MKKKRMRALAVFLALTIGVGTVDMSAYASESSVSEQLQQQVTVNESAVSSGDITGDECVQGIWDGTTTQSVFETDRCRMTFSLASHWKGGYNANIKIENISDRVIENWYISYDFDNIISNIWNAEIHSHENGSYIIKNAGWNQDIAVGGSVEFGFSSNEDFMGFPQTYQLLCDMVETNSEDYSVEYHVDSDWGSGFTGTITITNNTDKILEDWILEFDFNNDITSIWDGKINSHEGSHYVIYNAEYNQNINANGSISIGFLVSNGMSGNVISNVLLYNYANKAAETTREKEPLESIGEAYYKETSKEDVVVNEETGIVYVKNQILVSAYLGVEKSIIEEIAAEIGAEIVGYIALTNDYQLEFRENKSDEEIDIIINYINSFSFISYASLNMVEERESEIVTTNDALYNDGFKCGLAERDIDGDGKSDSVTTYNSGTDDWSEAIPNGDNWGLEALKVLTAWENKASFQPVKVGVYDNEFSEHEDIVFDDIYNNPSVIDNGHGMHVSGILAAQHDNGHGVSGVATDTRLYGYSSNGLDYGSSMGDKFAYATLIGNHVKVINVSLGMGQVVQYAASHGNEKAINYIESSADILEEYLNKLVLAGYDFLIVTSAGNTENIRFVQDSSAIYGYRKYDEDSDKGATTYSGEVQAYYDCALTAIDSPSLKNRIVVVGAIGHSVSNKSTTYYYAGFSNVGDRVDVCAPGVNILSTVPTNVEVSGYQLKSGTSMASPYVASIAALIYQVNPSIKAPRVKSLLCTSGSINVTDSHGNFYIIPDASVCYTKAKNTLNYGNTDVYIPSGILAGYVNNKDKVAVSGVQITALRKSTGEYNLDDYSFSFCTDENGYYMGTLPQGIYDLVIYANGYLPYAVKDVEILPDKTKYMETFMLSKWVSLLYNGVSVNGSVIDALKGTAISNATVKLRKGWNNTSGAYVTTLIGLERSAETDSTGKFSISAHLGAYTAEISKKGYVTAYYNVVAGDTGDLSVLAQTTMVLTPILSDDEYRIVLTWGLTPNDLDSHLTYYVEDKQQFHVYYANRYSTYNGEKVAELDLDDVTSYGPETVTVTLKTSLLEDGVFRYSVHNYSGGNSTTSKDLSLSGAMVRVYTGNDLTETYYVPRNVAGTVWHVFDIDINGISVVNEFYSANAGGVR